MYTTKWWSLAKLIVTTLSFFIVKINCFTLLVSFFFQFYRNVKSAKVRKRKTILSCVYLWPAQYKIANFVKRKIPNCRNKFKQQIEKLSRDWVSLPLQRGSCPRYLHHYLITFQEYFIIMQLTITAYLPIITFVKRYFLICLKNLWATRWKLFWNILYFVET